MSTWQRDGRAARVARHERDDGGEVAAGAVAADRETPGVDAELACVRDDPARGGPGVVDRRRELVLGRQAIVDGDDRDPGLGAVICRHCTSCVSRSPITQPPPW